MPRTSARQARLTADRLRRRINQTDFAIADAQLPIRISVSLGVAVSDPQINKGGGVTAVCASADKALFQAKNGGRNQVAMGQSAA
jgi:diguanylate cyclase (GGDEF)-like protein